MDKHVEVLDDEARRARIRENQRKMVEMGIASAKAELEAALTAEQAVKRPPRKPAAPRAPRQRIPEELQRRSGRLTGQERPDYRETHVSLEDVEARRRGGGGRGGGRGRGPRPAGDRIYKGGGWHPGKGEASGAATECALQAAQDFIDACDHPAFAKVLTHSMVSGGFWCNAPSGLSGAMPSYSSKQDFTAYLPEGEEPPQGARYLRESTGGWPVVWLPRPTGDAGFSGGWRGFAIDLDLYPGDVLVAEHPPQEGFHRASNGTFSLVFRIFRAFDFESEAVKTARAAACAQGEGPAAAASLLEADDLGEEGGEPGGGGTAAGGTSEAQAAATAEARKDAGRRQRRQQQQQQRQSKKLASQQQEKQQAWGGAAAGQKRKRASSRGTGGNHAAWQQKRTSGSTGKTASSKRGDGKGGGRAPKVVAVEQGEAGEGEQGTYIVERILGVRTDAQGDKRYLIKWEGYSSKSNSWEPRECLDADPASYRRAPGITVDMLK